MLDKTKSKSAQKGIVHLQLDISDRDMFQRLYPSCMTQFMRRAIARACVDKEFFDKVFFEIYN